MELIYYVLFVSCFWVLEFASVFFALSCRRLTSLRHHGCGFVVAQVHTTVLVYNYYHQKRFPLLEYACHDLFCMSTALTNKKLRLCT